MKALSIMQPWAWLIVNGHKAIENRNWHCLYRGPILIHAGKRIDKEPLQDLRNRWHPVMGTVLAKEIVAPDHLDCGGIVGEAEIIGCVEHSDDPWFVGRFGIVLRNARPLPFRPCKGALGFFTPKFEEVAHV